MGRLTIRPAVPGDGPGLADLHRDTATTLRQLEPERFRIPDPDGMAEWIDDDLTEAGEDWICFVAEENGQIVGQVEAKLHPPMDSARFQTMSDLGRVRGEVNSLGVRASHRRRGIGRALMEQAERWLTDRGATSIVLDTYLGSTESTSFYASIGYTRTSAVFEKRVDHGSGPSVTKS